MKVCDGLVHILVDPDLKNIQSRLCQGMQDEEATRGSKSLACFSVAPLEAVNALVTIMMSVSWSNKGKPLKLRHYDISQAHFQGTAQRLIYIRLPAEDRQKYGEDKVGR